MKDLAIVIPAYKGRFLENTLESLAMQTDQQFTVYVGDDASNDNIREIADKFRTRLDIHYHRFADNMGGKELALQWMRCIDLCSDEPWIWLFSDDDVLEENCVELFHKALDEHPGYEIYHFDTKVIDNTDQVTKINPPYPIHMSARDFYKSKMCGRLLSYVVENVFSRKIYVSSGGFENFDLAWGSDTATWTKFAAGKGMRTVRGASVRWRWSGDNISSEFSTESCIRKMDTLEPYFSWAEEFFNNERDIRLTNYYAYMMMMRSYARHVPREITNKKIREFISRHYSRWPGAGTLASIITRL